MSLCCFGTHSKLDFLALLAFTSLIHEKFGETSLSFFSTRSNLNFVALLAQFLTHNCFFFFLDFYRTELAAQSSTLFHISFSVDNLFPKFPLTADWVDLEF